MSGIIKGIVRLTKKLDKLGRNLIKSVFGSLFGSGSKPSVDDQSSRQRMNRSPNATHELVYGKTMKSGVCVLVEETGTNREYLHLVIALAPHKVKSIGTVYFNDKPSSDFPSQYFRIKKHLGDANQVADSDLVAEVSKWTTNHRLRGIAYVYVRFKFDKDGKVWANGVPNVKVEIEGKNDILDIRTGTRGYSTNPALCLLDYATSAQGAKLDMANIPTAKWIAAANACDEPVAKPSGGTEPRYTLNGVVKTETSVSDNFDSMVTAMAGNWSMTLSGFVAVPGVYQGVASVSLDEDDFLSDIKINPRSSRKDTFNVVRGQFIDPDSVFMPADFPEVRDASLVSQFGQDIVEDVELPFTQSASMAQRIAKLSLARNKNGLTAEFESSTKGMLVNVGENISLTNATLGWNNYVVRVVDMDYNPRNGNVKLSIAEENAAQYAYADGNLSSYTPPPRTSLPSAHEVPAVTGLLVVSKHKVAPTGQVKAAVFASWTAPNFVFIERYEIQYSKSGQNQWTGYVATEPKFLLNDLVEGDAIDIRVRAVANWGSASDWLQISHTVDTKSAPPAAPTGFSATGAYGRVQLKWTNATDHDLYGTEIYVSNTNDVSTAFWLATVPAPANSFRHAVSAGQTKYYWAKSVDTTGNKSIWFTSVGIPATASSFSYGDLSGQVPLSNLPNQVRNNQLILNPDGYLYDVADQVNRGRVTIGGLGYLGHLNATRNTGALANLNSISWNDGVRLTNRPAELTDGRISAGLSASGDIRRNVSLPLLPNQVRNDRLVLNPDGHLFDSADNVNRGRVTIGGLGYTGHLNATRNTGALANLNSISWNDGSRFTNRPVELTDGRISAGLSASGYIRREIPHSIKIDSNIANQNMLRMSDWKVGTNGNQGNFITKGGSAENYVVLGTGPNGDSEALWECRPDSGNDGDGGWGYNNIPIDRKKTYRATVWMKSNTGGDGAAYFGCGGTSTTLNLSGSANSNPYFWTGDLPEDNKWYLLVGIIHGEDYGTSYSGIAGIYDPVTGKKVVGATEFKMSSTATTQIHRVYHYYNTSGNSAHRQWMARPRFEVLDSSSPSIIDLLGSATVGATDQQARQLKNNKTIFYQTFDNQEEVDEWTSRSGSGEQLYNSSADSFRGGGVMQVGNNSGNDQRWLVHRDNIPYDPDKLYKVTVYAYKTVGLGLAYFGVEGVADDGVTYVNSAGYNSWSSQHYIAASGVNIPSGFTKYVGYFSGHAASSNGGVRPDPSNPATLHKNVRFFRPLMVVNYSGATGRTFIDAFTIEVFPKEASRLGENGKPTNQRFYRANMVMNNQASQSGGVVTSTKVGSSVRVNIAASSRVTDVGTINYNAGAISGLAFNTTYYIYALDPNLNGGAVTYLATTSYTSIAANSDRTYFGKVRTVSSSGGGGTISKPENLCVSVLSYMPNVGLARDIRECDPLVILSEDMRGVEDYEVKSVKFGTAECSRITTESGIDLVCSNTTPLTLLDGRLINVLDGLNEYVPCLDDGHFKYEKIVQIKHVGIRRVAKIHCDMMTYAAGEQEGRYILTHNAVKP